MFDFVKPPPLSLYVHVPWCVRKCPYCDFNSHALRDALPQDAYIDALLADLDQEISRAVDRMVETIFIGGGTPSLLSPAALERLLTGIRKRLAQGSGIEITLEANPGTAEQAKFKAFRSLGINRLSIGAQSFDDHTLIRLGRIHTGREAARAAELARAAGFENINIDLMFGLPEQTVDDCLRDLSTAIGLAPNHISFYQLTIEPNTEFHHRPPLLPDDDCCWEMQRAGENLLADSGYTQYEVSAYARASARCRHNLNYWRFGDYLGIGAGAHGKLSGPGAINRRWKFRQPRQYMRAALDGGATGGERCLDEADAVFEFMLNALRLREGFELEWFTAHTGLPQQTIMPQLARTARDDLLNFDGRRITPTDLGWRFLNDLTARFIPG